MQLVVGIKNKLQARERRLLITVAKNLNKFLSWVGNSLRAMLIYSVKRT